MRRGQKAFAILGSASVLTAMVFFFGCGGTNAKPAKPHVAYGQIMSTWLKPQNNYGETHMVVGMEGEDGKLFTLEFNTIEPILWKGEKVEISYRQLTDGFGDPKFSPTDGRPILKLLAVRRLLK